MNNVMLDIETMGTACDSVIVQVSMIRFDKDGNMGETLSVKINTEEQLALGAKKYQDTIDWWQKTNPTLFESLTTGDDILSVKEALNKISAFVFRSDKVWSHAYFDAPLLGNLYQLAGIQTPWNYKSIRDIRTITDVANLDLTKYDWAKEKTHDALDDCRFQIKYCTDAMKIIDLYYRTSIQKWDEDNKQMGM